MSGGPLSRVLAAFDTGAVTVSDISRLTGLSPDMVRAAIDQLVRMGALESQALSAGCPPTGCSACGDAGTDTGTCGAGRTLISLSRTRTVD